MPEWRFQALSARYVLPQGCREVRSGAATYCGVQQDGAFVFEHGAPEFIHVNLSTKGCMLVLNRRVYSLRADEDAVPGNYTVKVIAIVREVGGDLPINHISRSGM